MSILPALVSSWVGRSLYLFHVVCVVWGSWPVQVLGSVVSQGRGGSWSLWFYSLFLPFLLRDQGYGPISIGGGGEVGLKVFPAFVIPSLAQLVIIVLLHFTLV